MKTTYSFFLFTAILTVLLFSSACEKEGPAGPPGADGINGTTGTNGMDGEDGNANVQLFLFEADNVFSPPTYGKKYEHPNFNQGLIDSSLVLVYWQIDAGLAPGSWRLVGTNLGTEYSTRWNWVDSVPFTGAAAGFFIEIDNASADGEYVSAPSGLNVTWDKVKFIIAPANVFVGKREVDFTNYEETMLQLGLQP